MPSSTDQLMPGQTYTFSYVLGNWFSLPDVAVVTSDLVDWGPQYMGALNVTQKPGANPFTNYYNVTFRYAGDGSDVISDVANEIAAAVKQGSNDTLNFDQVAIGATGESSGTDIANTTSTIGLSSSSLVLIVVGLAIVAFIMSGGTGVVRGLTEGAKS